MHTTVTPASRSTSPVAHLTSEDLEAIGRELDAIRDDVVADLGEDDAKYIRKVIGAQRALEVTGRGSLMVSLFPPAWVLGTTALSLAKVLENMEIGHNVMHGQWDWMRDPEIHSSTWEWDNVSAADGWKHSHNFEHHTFTNVIGKDRDLGYEIMRVDPAQEWKPIHLAQPAYNVALALLFQWGVAVHDVGIHDVRRGNKTKEAAKADLGRFLRKARKQLFKDYVLFPALAGPSAVPAFVGTLTANVARNVWSHAIIFCGHFPDEVQTFEYTEAEMEAETRGGWYVRQLLGSANIDGPPLFHLMAGNLSYQIEHHLFPDLPSSRYAQVAPQVREICERYGLPYVSGPLYKQYAQVLGKIARYALPGGGDSEKPPTPAVDPAPERAPLHVVAA